MIDGAEADLSADSIPARSARPTASSANRRTDPRPNPSIPSAFTALACTYPLLTIDGAGNPTKPFSATSTRASKPTTRAPPRDR